MNANWFPASIKVKLALLAMVYATSSITARAQANEGDAPPSPINDNQVAILHWYAANQTATFSVASTHNAGPHAVVFDGANIWTANLFDGTVTKLRASDGTNLGTFTVGSFPLGAAYDGANIWVTNCGSNTVTKLLASDGSTVGTFAAGNCPLGVAFDGANIWVANINSGTLSKL